MTKTFRAAIFWITEGERASCAVNAFLKRQGRIADKWSVMAAWWDELEEEVGGADPHGFGWAHKDLFVSEINFTGKSKY